MSQYGLFASFSNLTVAFQICVKLCPGEHGVFVEETF